MYKKNNFKYYNENMASKLCAAIIIVPAFVMSVYSTNRILFTNNLSVECDFKDTRFVPYDATVHDCTHYATVLHESMFKTNIAHDGRTVVHPCDVKARADIRDEDRKIDLCSPQSRRGLQSESEDLTVTVIDVVAVSVDFIG